MCFQGAASSFYSPARKFAETAEEKLQPDTLQALASTAGGTGTQAQSDADNVSPQRELKLEDLAWLPSRRDSKDIQGR